MEVLVPGLEVAIRAPYREYGDRHRQVESDDDLGDHSASGDRAFDEPTLLGLSQEVSVPVDEVGVRMGDLLAEVEQGAHVVIVEDGRRAAVMTSWPASMDAREERAGMAAAFWSAWRSGVLDAAGYATDLTRILHNAGTKPDPSSEGEGRTSEGGEGDERVP